MSHYTHIIVQPAFINSSATQSQWAAIFPQKATTTVCLGFCFHPSSMTVMNRPAQNYLSPVMLWLQFTCESLNKYRYALLVSKIFTSEVCEAACGGEGTRDKDDSN